MKKTLFFLILILSFYQCNSQKNTHKKNLVELKTTNIENPKYFIGNWFNTKTIAINGAEKQLQTQTNCEKTSYWKFVYNNNILKQSLFTAKGKNCSEYISTNFGIVDFREDNMIYRTDDVVFSVRIRIISDTEFILMTKNLINGKLKDIEKTYIKSK